MKPGRRSRSEPKGSNDFVTNVDKAEAVRLSTIRHPPQHTPLSPKKAVSTLHRSDVQWLSIRLDGTTNFIKRLPLRCFHCCTHKGRTEVAVVYDPMRNELFTATRGQRTAGILFARQYRARSGRHYPRYWLPVQKPKQYATTLH